jgi:hypothetical protein
MHKSKYFRSFADLASSIAPERLPALLTQEDALRFHSRAKAMKREGAVGETILDVLVAEWRRVLTGVHPYLSTPVLSAETRMADNAYVQSGLVPEARSVIDETHVQFFKRNKDKREKTFAEFDNIVLAGDPSVPHILLFDATTQSDQLWEKIGRREWFGSILRDEVRSRCRQIIVLLGGKLEVHTKGEYLRYPSRNIHPKINAIMGETYEQCFKRLPRAQ